MAVPTSSYRLGDMINSERHRESLTGGALHLSAFPRSITCSKRISTAEQYDPND